MSAWIQSLCRGSSDENWEPTQKTDSGSRYRFCWISSPAVAAHTQVCRGLESRHRSRDWAKRILRDGFYLICSAAFRRSIYFAFGTWLENISLMRLRWDHDQPFIHFFKQAGRSDNFFQTLYRPCHQRLTWYRFKITFRYCFCEFVEKLLFRRRKIRFCISCSVLFSRHATRKQ